MSAIEKIAKGDERIGGKRRPSFFWIAYSRQSSISTLAGDAAVAGGIRRAQSGAIFDDGTGLVGEVSVDAPGKRVISGRCVLTGGETGPFRHRWEPVDQHRLKPLHREIGRPKQELESESQKGNPGSSVSRVGLSRTLLFLWRIAHRADAGRLAKRPSIACTLAQRPVRGGNLPLRRRVLGNASASKRRFHDRKCHRNLRRRAYGGHPCRRWRNSRHERGLIVRPPQRYGRMDGKVGSLLRPVRVRAGPVLRPAGDTLHAGAGQNRYQRFSTASARSSGLNNLQRVA
jgi:hypothetical protein